MPRNRTFTHRKRKIQRQQSIRDDSPAVPVEKIKHIWTDLQTDTLVQGVFEAINNNPNCFEQPNPKEFYEQLKSKSAILEPIPWLSLKTRMNSVKSQYLIFAALKEENCGTDMTMEYIHQQCPNSDKLAVIFNNCISDQIKPYIVYESGHLDNGDDNTNGSDIRNGSDEIVLKIEVASDVTPEPSGSQSCMEIESDPTTKRGSIRQCSQMATELPPIYKRPKKKKLNQYTPKDKLIKLQQLAYERQKLQFAKEKQRQDFEIKMIRMKNDLELKKYEIEKKLESEERLKKYEMELQLKNSLN